jgi:hypothetical protein
MSFLSRLRRLLLGEPEPAPPAPEVAVVPVPAPEPPPPPAAEPRQPSAAAEPAPTLWPPTELEPPPAVDTKLAPFVWSAPGRGGEVGYALREAVRERLGPASPAREAWKAFLLDVDLEPEDGSWLQRDTVYANPREGDWTKFRIPAGAAVRRVSRIADAATTTRLARATRLAYRGANVDPTEGLEGDVYEVLDGDHAGSFVYLGNGGRFGAAVWAAATTLVPGGSPGLADAALADELLALMRSVAIEHGAPGLAAGERTAGSEPVGEQRPE